MIVGDYSQLELISVCLYWTLISKYPHAKKTGQSSAALKTIKHEVEGYLQQSHG